MVVIAATTVIAAGWIDDAAAQGARQGEDSNESGQSAGL
jgi:hypothetical protein